MKVFAVLALLVAVAYASGVPEVVYDGPTYELTRIEDVDTDGGLATSSELPPIRHRRVTCDLLSFGSKWLTINHSACAAKCLTQHRKGGHCDNGICRCR